jgi:simple sugar transport system ATP-binding protein
MRNFFAGRELTTRFGLLDIGTMNDIVMDVLLNKVRIAGINSPDLLVEKLSGGQRQAVAIARSVYFKTEMLILDEPTSALSVRETEKVLTHVVELKQDGVSAVLITHNIYQAYQVCDRFVILSRGRVVKSVTRGETSVRELSDIIVMN